MLYAFGGFPQQRGLVEIGFIEATEAVCVELVVVLNKALDLQKRDRIYFESSIRNSSGGIDHARIFFNDDVNVANYNSMTSVIAVGGGPTSSSGRFIDMPASSNMWAMGAGWIGRNPHGYLTAHHEYVIGGGAVATPDQHNINTVTWAGGGDQPPPINKIRYNFINGNNCKQGDYIRVLVPNN